MASKTLSYKAFTGTAEIDVDDGICFGRLLFIDDLIMYEADAPAGLQAAFQEAVDDYLETCAAIGKQPQKPCSGSFNVRISPEKHRAAVLLAAADGVKLNEVVARAVDCYLSMREGISRPEIGPSNQDAGFQTILAGGPSANWRIHVTH